MDLIATRIAAPDLPHRGPLSGIRVLDLSRLLPGPYCSQLLVDMGADVIKIETPKAGDYARLAPSELGFDGVFDAVNRGKRSVAVNYRSKAGRDVVLRLARDADVFIESSRPGQLDRRGLGYADVRTVQPGIVYCSLSGYGQTGPYHDRPGHDLDYLAVSGVLSMLMPPGASPAPPGVQLADLAGATSAANAILAALFDRERTGVGAYLDIAIIDAVVAMLGPLGSSATSASRRPGPLAGAYPCYQIYSTADGEWLAVGALEPPFWHAFCRSLERSDLVGRQFDADAIAEVRRVLKTRTCDEWLEIFEDDACVTKVNHPHEAFSDPQVRARAMVSSGGSSNGGLTPAGATAGRARHAPGLGEHTESILRETGIPAQDIAALIEGSVIAATGSRPQGSSARGIRHAA